MDIIFFQGFSIQGLSMLILLVLIAILTTILIVRHKKEKGKDEKEKNFMNWVEKKDILYWLLIISLGSISVITYEYKTYNEVISHWGFAGTIVSIILAIVAIGFTLFQTLSSNLSSDKIASSADIIEKASAGLDSSKLLQASEILTSTSENIAEFNLKVETRLDELNRELLAIKDAHVNSNHKLDGFFSNFESSNISNNENGSTIESTELIDIHHFLENVFPSLTYNSKFFVYSYFFLASERSLGKKNNRQKFSDAYTNFCYKESEHNTDEVSYYEVFFPFYFGSLSICSSFINSFGIVKAYRNLEINERKDLLIQYEKMIKPKDLDFLKKFILEDDLI